MDSYSHLLCLYLLCTTLPYIKPPPKPQGDATSTTTDPLAIPSAVLLHLCELLDSPQADPKAVWLAQDIVTEGVVVFFPDAKARKDYLLSMIASVLVSKSGVLVSRVSQ